MDEPAAEQLSRSERIKAGKRRKFAELYAGKTFDIVREVTMPVGQVFSTALGSKACHGYVIRDRETGEQQIVGWTVLKRIHALYLGVTPPSERTRKKARPTC